MLVLTGADPGAGRAAVVMAAARLFRFAFFSFGFPMDREATACSDQRKAVGGRGGEAPSLTAELGTNSAK